LNPSLPHPTTQQGTKGNKKRRRRRRRPPSNLIEAITLLLLLIITMKLSLAIFAMALTYVAASYISIPIAERGLAADSDLGMKILSKARRVDEQEAVDITWVSGYSLKFQGCHHVQQVRRSFIICFWCCSKEQY
jgi:hypothetical protein